VSDPGKAVFLSYASQDAEAAKRIADALRAAGVEVWFDQSELVGGDAWDAKIRKQIKECALLIPVISAATQARTEGYFRLEWRLADQRTHLMAKGRAFLLPVVIDDTKDNDAHVPDSFTEVQWTRLKGGETPTAFAERVKRLLDGETSSRESGSRPVPPVSQELSPPAQKSRPWLWPVILGAVAIAVAAVWLTRKPAPTPAIEPTAVAVQPAAAPQTEAQKLVAQARKIYDDGDELNRDNLFLADEIVQRALALDPSEPSAWELATWFSYIMAWHGIDVTQARRETLLRQANRAIALAPDSVTAQLVYANAQLAGRFGGANASPGNFAQIEASLKQLAGREPQNWKIQRALGTVYRVTQRMDEAVRAFNRAIELSGGDPMATADLVNVLIRRNHFAEAEVLLARELPRHRTSRLLTFNLIVKYRWRGDAESAAKDIADWPEWLLQQDRGFAVAWQAALWARQPDLALHLVLQFPRQEVRDIIFSGPKAVLSARAQELAGNTVAAQADWQAVRQQCDQDLAANASDLTALYWKAWALARLGDQTGAQGVATLLRQRLQSVPSNYIHSYTAAALWATVGWTDVAVATLQAELQTPTDYISLSRAGLELEPAFDSIRNDPRFRALVVAAPAPASAPLDQPKVDPKSIAVLPFANLSEDKDNAFFADGMHEDILTHLGEVRALHVTSRTSVLQYRGTTKSIRQIGAELGVAFLLEGSVRRAGNKVRVTGQLINAHTDEHVWAKAYDRDLTDIFAIQSELAQAIAAALSAALSPQEKTLLENRPTDNLAAYDLFLKARANYFNNSTDLSATQVEELLREAVRLDPAFAQAWAYLGWRHARAYFDEDDHSPERLAQAKAAIETAVRLAPDDPEVIERLGNYYYYGYRDYGRAAEQYQRLLQLRPNSDRAHAQLAYLYRRQGRWVEGLASLREAARLAPLFVGHARSVADTLGGLRRYDEAAAAWRLATELSAGDATLGVNVPLMAYLARGSTREMDEWLAAQRPAAVGETKLLQIRRSWARLHGDWAQAVAINGQHPYLDPWDDPHWAQDFGAIWDLLGAGETAAARTQAARLIPALEALAGKEPANARLWGTLGLLHAISGDKAAALRCARQAQQLLPESADALIGPNYSMIMAQVLAWTGDHDGALREIARLLRVPFGSNPLNVHVARHDPGWLPLRGDPRFEALLNDPQNNAPLF
jgi:TolB-like protein/Flp pilus assembly protein TadD